jgi:hypothetical protein
MGFMVLNQFLIVKPNSETSKGQSMATIRKQILGEVHGGISQIKIKYRNGKPYVAGKPGYFNMGKDPVTLFKKDQGRFIGKLSKEIYKIDLLKKIWTQNDVVKGYTYQQIWGRNFKSIKVDDLSGFVALIPQNDFTVINPEIEISDNHTGRITVSSFGVGNGINPSIEKKILAAGIIILKNHIGVNESAISYLTINSKPIDFDLTNPIEIALDILPLSSSAYIHFQIKKSYITLITLDDAGSPIHCSEVITAG